GLGGLGGELLARLVLGTRRHGRVLALLGAGISATLLHLRRLADAIAQVVELRAPDLALALDRDLLDVGRVERKDALDAFARDDAPHGEGAANPASASDPDDRAGEDL